VNCRCLLFDLGVCVSTHSVLCVLARLWFTHSQAECVGVAAIGGGGLLVPCSQAIDHTAAMIELRRLGVVQRLCDACFVHCKHASPTVAAHLAHSPEYTACSFWQVLHACGRPTGLLHGSWSLLMALADRDWVTCLCLVAIGVGAAPCIGVPPIHAAGGPWLRLVRAPLPRGLAWVDVWRGC
jgi:hypothetical protein